MDAQKCPFSVGIKAPDGFKIHAVPDQGITPEKALVDSAPLGPLVNFVGQWTGLGFNTIFRPNQPGSDNILELNLTTEALTFSPSLGSIPNRGLLQGDIFLNGVPYLQTVNDVTTPGKVTGIHFEPGIWLNVPLTTNPNVPITLARMASIPHGTTINAQGTSSTQPLPPVIPALDITPFFTGTSNKQKFSSQTASDQSTPRIPQVLPVAGTKLTVADWQAMLDDPNSVIRNAVNTQKVTQTTTISITTANSSPAPAIGGGTRNIAFLVGQSAPNADAVSMAATFWIETISMSLEIPVAIKPKSSEVVTPPQTSVPNLPLPSFQIHTVKGIPAKTTVTVTYPQIQYSQLVQLVFAPLTWPHASVATLVPATPVKVNLP